MIPSAIDITQDNIVSGATLLSINNPLVFIITVTYTGTVDDTIECLIYDSTNTVISEDLVAVAYQDVSNVQRKYIFNADQILRGYNASIQEWIQTVNTLSLDPNSNTFKIEFNAYDTEGAGATQTDSVTFNTIQGSTQFGSSPSKVSIYTNANSTQIAYYGYWGYTYFYNASTAALKLTSGAGGVSTATGLVRAKVNGLTLGINNVEFYRDAVYTATHLIECREFCSGQKLIKYMDRNGMFRFYAFNQYYQEKINAKELGRTSKLITNILSDQTNSLSIGKNVDKFIDLTADATSSDLLLLEDLFVSPLIFMYIGSGNDTAADWIVLKIADGDFITRIKKGNTTKVNLTFEYPEQYSIKRF